MDEGETMTWFENTLKHVINYGPESDCSSPDGNSHL
jgi:hypothetical protein